MFDPTSRYHNIETATITFADGRVARYKRRRFLPAAEALPLLGEVRVAQGDRLDVFTARVLGDPEQFWRICDANEAIDPAELTAVPGRSLRVPSPQP